MDTNIFVPKKINVGYQNRRGTYTGKLAYIIYYDEKGVLRKEKSWQNWRDKSIPNEEFENVPTSGFVLNKKVGDYKVGWNHRQAYCRVYDPRNFEFEITFENLLYILENVTSTKGKGLEGDFVYGWSGTELVLLPVDSPDYKEIQSYTTKIETAKSFKLKDLVVGHTYKDKADNEYLYMGKHECFEQGYLIPSDNVETLVMNSLVPRHKKEESENIYASVGMKLWFASVYKTHDEKIAFDFNVYRNVPKTLIKTGSEKVVDYYAEAVEAMERKPEFCRPDRNRLEFVPYDLKTFKTLFNKSSYYTSRENVFHDGVFSDSLVQYRLVNKTKDGYVTIQLETNKGNMCLNNRCLRGVHIQECIDDFKKRCDVQRITNSDNYHRYSFDYTNKDIYVSGPYTAEEVFDILNPGYVKSYLQNGNPYLDVLNHL